MLDLYDSATQADLLRQAYAIALNSPDPSTQNGGFALDENGGVVGIGCNEFTKGMEVTPDLLERPKKYAYIEHAERNVLFDTIVRDIGRPDVLVVPWLACADCARAIVQSGVRRVLRHVREDATGRWGGSIEDGDNILNAGGVEIIEYVGELGGCEPIMFAEEKWTP